jgi:hypothetical protein
MKPKDKLFILLCLLGAFLCMAGIVRGADEPKPAITDAQKAAAWKAQALFLPAAQEYERRKGALEGIASELSRACGEKADLRWDAEDISCVPKPDPPKEPEK